MPALRAAKRPTCKNVKSTSAQKQRPTLEDVGQMKHLELYRLEKGTENIVRPGITLFIRGDGVIDNSPGEAWGKFFVQSIHRGKDGMVWFAGTWWITPEEALERYTLSKPDMDQVQCMANTELILSTERGVVGQDSVDWYITVRRLPDRLKVLHYDIPFEEYVTRAGLVVDEETRSHGLKWIVDSKGLCPGCKLVYYPDGDRQVYCDNNLEDGDEEFAESLLTVPIIRGPWVRGREGELHDWLKGGNGKYQKTFVNLFEERGAREGLKEFKLREECGEHQWYLYWIQTKDIHLTTCPQCVPAPDDKGDDDDDDSEESEDSDEDDRDQD
ncbi:hypothetical protein EST38_g11183 [Candolleomyces aberdarensis]|uniref:BAH domain-containing protein n=1 Tax=Candolleomyces aberdarensis TaxID=2316362 RepID=A0A4Q2D5I4_9AGAR|nr:hypothetical protein EST38_g11183 [Candolleomyces aberdarensis]